MYSAMLSATTLSLFPRSSAPTLLHFPGSTSKPLAPKLALHRSSSKPLAPKLSAVQENLELSAVREIDYKREKGLDHQRLFEMVIALNPKKGLCIHGIRALRRNHNIVYHRQEFVHKDTPELGNLGDPEFKIST